MVNSCSVYNCESGRRRGLEGHSKETNKSFFKCSDSSGDRFLKWQKIFDGTPTKISPKSLICEKHFYSSDINTEKVITNPVTGKVIFHRFFKNKSLKKNAVPIFIIYDETTSQWTAQNSRYDTIEDSKNEMNLEYASSNFDDDDNRECIADLVSEFSKTYGDNIFDYSNEGITIETIFEQLCKENANVLFPDSTWGVHKNISNKYIMFSQLVTENEAGNAPEIRKKVLVHEDGQTEIYFLNKRITTLQGIQQIVESINQVEQLLQIVHNLNICVGGPSLKMYSSVINVRCSYKDNISYKWRHNLCPVYIENGVICRKCATLDQVLRRHIVVNKQLKREQNNQARSLKRAKIKLEKFLSTNKIDWVDIMVEKDS